MLLRRDAAAKRALNLQDFAAIEQTG